MQTSLPVVTALVVVDVQSGFDDPAWGRRNNPGCDANIASLVRAFADGGRPVIYVRHDSRDPSSPLHPSSPGNALKSYLAEHRPALLVTKSVNSSFHGTPDLHSWLTEAGVTGLFMVGTTMTADELSRATATNLHGEFATVVTTEDVLRALAS